MTAKKAARTVHLAEAMRFSPEARTNQEIMATDTMVVRMNCYEPGQVTPMHLHPDEDEIIYVVEGAGKFIFKDADDLPFRAGDLVCLPSDQFHQIEAGPEGRTVVIYFMTPDYQSVRPADREAHPAIKALHGERH